MEILDVDLMKSKAGLGHHDMHPDYAILAITIQYAKRDI